MSNIKIILADDHKLVRAGIKTLLEQIKNIEIIGEANDGFEAIKLIEEFTPDLALLDISMPGLNGLEVLNKLSKSESPTKIILLSMYSNKEYVLRALKYGAAGYLLKDAAWEELEIAITKVMMGESYLSSKVTRHVTEYFKNEKPGITKDQIDEEFEQLSERHREILQLIGEGFSTKEMATKLNLSVNTIESHRKELMRRLDIHDIAGLVRYSIKIGLVSPE
jgi:Response regulator containing a CheY-like receiver domain and an HTH DNA-binding domain